MDQTRRILVVAGSPVEGENYRQMLECPSSVSAEIRCSTSSAEALDLSRSLPVHCVVVDREATGLGVAPIRAQLQRSGQLPQPPIVMIGGDEDDLEWSASEREGVTYLAKSQVTARSIRHIVEAALDRQHDLCTIARQREELQRLKREFGQFTYAATHDLQAPLRRIQSFCDLLRRQCEGHLDEEADELMQFVVESAQQMQRLVDRLLEFGRTVARVGPQDSTDCTDVVQQVLAKLHTEIAACGGQLTHDPLPTVDADRVQMVRLFENLIDNAIKFRGDAALQIHVSAVTNDCEATFCVRDNGIGIDGKYAEQIFEPLKRLHSEDQYPGAGIGLAICRTVVQQHHGRIWVESQLGEGSQFYATVRRRQVTASLEAAH